jgi:hypothetical protein
MFARTCSNALSSSDHGGDFALKRNVCMRSDPLASRIAAWLAVLAIAIVADAEHDALPADRAPEFTHTLDADYSYWNALSNRYWPAFYVVDARGNVAAQAIGEMHTGERRAVEFERQIEQLLRARTAATAP